MTEEDALDAAIAQSLGLSQSPDESGDYHGAGPDGAAPPPEAGVSFANIAKMGFAATGPKLSPGAPELGELEPVALLGACMRVCMLFLVHRSVRVGVHACVHVCVRAHAIVMSSESEQHTWVQKGTMFSVVQAMKTAVGT